MNIFGPIVPLPGGSSSQHARTLRIPLVTTQAEDAATSFAYASKPIRESRR